MTAVDPHADPYAEQADRGSLRFLHRLNPLAKVAGPLPAMVLLIFTRDLMTPLTFLALAVGLLLVGAYLSGRARAGLLLGVPVAVAVLSLSFGLWTDPERADTAAVAFAIGDRRIDLGVWAVGVATALRLTGLLTLALLGGLTTTGPEFVRACVQQLRLPYRIGYTTLAALRFVPRFRHELDVIRSAHRVRGMAGGRGPLAGARRYVGYVVPLLAGAIRHAERVALAMDARAFGAASHRTERHVIPFRARDVVFIAAFWAVTATVFATAAAPFG